MRNKLLDYHKSGKKTIIFFFRTSSKCFIYAVGRADANVKANPSMDYYEFNCESQFGGMALCTNEGIRFIVNTKEPYTGAIYAAERFSTCSQVLFFFYIILKTKLSRS